MPISPWTDFDEWYTDKDEEECNETHYDAKRREQINNKTKSGYCNKCNEKLKVAVGPLGSKWPYCPKCEP